MSIQKCFAMVLPNGQYINIQMVSSHLGRRANVREAFDIEQAETVASPNLRGLPHDVKRAILDHVNHQDEITFVPIVVTRKVERVRDHG